MGWRFRRRGRSETLLVMTDMSAAALVMMLLVRRGKWHTMTMLLRYPRHRSTMLLQRQIGKGTGQDIWYCWTCDTML
jgi:hypothetical protein